MNEELKQPEKGRSGIDRRTMLKAAAVAGVTAPFWASPTVTAFGPTPRFSEMCTSGFDNYALGSRNTSCNCGSPQTTKYVQYKELGTPCAGDGNLVFPGVAKLTNGNNGPLINDSGTCPQNPSDGTDDAGVTATTNNPNLSCRTVVRIWQGGSCGNTFQEFAGPIFTGSGFYPLPAIACTGGGNIFISVILRCSLEPECL